MRAQPPDKVGIGLSYQPALRSFIDNNVNLLDFVEVIPDLLWTDSGQGCSPRFIEDRTSVLFIERLASRIPVIPHSIGLSLGTAHRFDTGHVHQLERWYQWLCFPWHSDHLSFSVAQAAGGEVNVGLTLPVALDHDILELFDERVRYIRERIPVPFLVENNVYYFDLLEQDYTEAQFLDELSERSGCGLLLDLHNVYVNTRNAKQSPLAFVQDFPLHRVMEIHVAGGMELDGYYLDAHSGPIPQPVWELLDWTLRRCPNVRGVTFEILGSWVAPMGEERLAEDLLRLRATWQAHLELQHREQ